MKRWGILLLVLGLALAMAAPATAKKKPHPPGNTCTQIKEKDPSWITASHDGDLSFSFGPETGNDLKFCIDVNGVDAGDWHITVTILVGKLRALTVVLRDSVAAGDACGVLQLRKVSGTVEHTFMDVPASGVDACGDAFPDSDSGDGYADEAFTLLVFARAHAKSQATVRLRVTITPITP